jgi:hypothetical protein
MNRDQFSSYSKRYKNKSRLKLSLPQHIHLSSSQENNGFKCKHCNAYIQLDSFFSGVKNRNHCPYCLWSKHVDLFKAGDRLSACKGLMQPIGLSLKQTYKKYTHSHHGELMLIHRCIDCGSFSINRIAADDDAGKMFDTFIASTYEDGFIRDVLKDQGIWMLNWEDQHYIYQQLLGKESIEQV